MAQYDGSIRINTQINTRNASAQLASLENRIVKTADKIASLRSKMDTLKDAQVPTREYAGLQKEIDSTERKLLSLYDRQERFLETGGREGSPAYRKMAYDAEVLEGKLERAEQAMQRLVDSGKAFTLGSETQEYANLGQQLRYAENDLAVLERRYSEVTERNNQAQASYSTLSERAKNSLKAIGKAMASVPTNLLKAGVRNIISLFERLKSSALSALKITGSSIKKFAISPLNLMATTAKKAFSSIGKSSKSSNNILGSGFKNILKYGLGIRSLYALVNKFRTAVKEGFGNLYGEADDFKASVDDLRASALTLKNSFAAAFRPLVEIAIPYIQKAVDYMTILMDKIGQFFAAMTGQKTYTKAIRQTADAFKEEAEATEEAQAAAEGYLSPLDEINKYSEGKSGGADKSKGGGADESKPQMFEMEVPISDKFKNIAQWFKNMWADADFTELGALLGNKLKNALDNIPWEGIRETAGKIGKSIATLINGFVEVAGLGRSIGNTLAQAINTGFEFLNSFVHNLHWDSVGKFIADTLNGLFTGIDWNLIYDTFVTGAKGLGDAINSFAENLDWKAVADTVSNFVNTFVDTVYTFFSTVDWKGMGEKVGTLISDSLAGIDWVKFGNMIGTGLQSVLDFLLSTVKNIEWGKIGTYIADALNGVVESVDLSTVGELLGTTLTGLFDMAINFAKDFDWIKLGDNIANGINGFFKKFDGKKFAKAATGLISGLLDTIIETIDKTDWAAIWKDIIDFLVNVNWIEIIGKLVIAAGKLIAGIVSGLIQAIRETDWKDVWNRILKAFKEFFGIHSPSKVMEGQGSYIISGLLDGLKNNIGKVIEWLKNIPVWFKEKFDLAYEKVKNAFSGARDFFKGVWDGIKSAFGNITDWFKDKFSAAWQAVKNVFSSGGQVFSGIKDGILDGLKFVINSLIDGINNVIAIPFNGINSALDAIRNVEILGYYPFGWLPWIDVPQIPHLATGTVVPPNREFLAMLGDNKREPEIVSPISTMKQANKEAVLEALSELGLIGGNAGGNNGTIIIKQYLDGKQITESVIKNGKLQLTATGRNPFLLGTT